MPELDPVAVAEIGERLRANIRRAVKVRDEVLEQLIVSLIAEGHVLIEDYPGVGKTALARSLARSIDAAYARVQCTVDLLPADVVGTNVFNQRDARFEFHPGPVFANIVLVDEINRASPKTQSGLLECMQERRVTVDGQAHELARPFLVIATQNPVDYEGTYPLPEAQLDRFMVRLELGYPDAGDEAAMLAEHAAPTGSWTWSRWPSVGSILAAQAAAGAMHAQRGAARATWWRCARRPAPISGSSSAQARGPALLLFRAAKARAALDGRDHALPDDVQALAHAVLEHRLLLAPGAGPGERTAVGRGRPPAHPGALSGDESEDGHPAAGGGLRASAAAAFGSAGALRTRRRDGDPGRRPAGLGEDSARRPRVEPVPGPWSIIEGESYPLGVESRHSGPAAGEQDRAPARRSTSPDRGPTLRLPPARAAHPSARAATCSSHRRCSSRTRSDCSAGRIERR